MRKRVMDRVPPMDEDWLDLQRLAKSEVTSEDAAYPIEAALVLVRAQAGGRRTQGSRRSGFFLKSPIG